MSTEQMLLAFPQDGAKKPEAAGRDDNLPAAGPAPKKERHNRQQKLCDSLKTLPTVTIKIIPPEALTSPGSCRRIGEETSERLEVSPSTFTRHVTVRPTFVRKAAPVTAPMPPALLTGSVRTASLEAHPLTEKFCYHKPFWRQGHRLAKHRHLHVYRADPQPWLRSVRLPEMVLRTAAQYDQPGRLRTAAPGELDCRSAMRAKERGCVGARDAITPVAFR